MQRHVPIQNLQDKLAIAARDNFNGALRVAGLGAALRGAADAVLGDPRAGEAAAPHAALAQWRRALENYESASELEKKQIVARGLRVVRAMPASMPPPPPRATVAAHAASRGSAVRLHAAGAAATAASAPGAPVDAIAVAPALAAERNAVDAPPPPRRQTREPRAPSRARPVAKPTAPSADAIGARDTSSRPMARRANALTARPDDLLAQPTSALRGIGPAFSEALAAGEVHTVEDLLWLTPARYDDARLAIAPEALRPVADGATAVRVVVRGAVRHAKMIFARGRRWAEVGLIGDGSVVLVVRFFNAWAGFEAKYPVGTEVVVAGAVKWAGAKPSMANPDVLVASGAAAASVGIVCHYPRIAGVPPARVRSACALALAGAADLRDELPPSVAAMVALPTLPAAVHMLHAPPPTLDAAASAALVAKTSPWHQRLAFGDLLVLAVAAAMRRKQRQGDCALPCPMVPEFAASLAVTFPFALTSAQQRAIAAISDDLGKTVPMNRLLEGDVGSGKTAVAFAAALLAAKNGMQVAVMAPTEVLAEQLERQFRTWAAPHHLVVAGLSASVPAGSRASTLGLVAAGAVHIVVGTHALLSQQLAFARLGLVIIDEQQRFGVQQRTRLREKGDSGTAAPHLLVMSATPIPRSLALTAFGDLDCSVLDELPKGRQPIATRVVPAASAWQVVVEAIRAAVARQEQVYVVCPTIAASEEATHTAGLDAETLAPALAKALHGHMASQVVPTHRGKVSQRAKATVAAAAVAAPTPAALPPPTVAPSAAHASSVRAATVGIVHGQLDAQTRDATMRAFRDGAMDVLVATTVIEVGVDNPNATLMVIVGADRFGLSQLHQLRGRVGRGTRASTCLLWPSKEPTEYGAQRMAAMLETTDGFRIAEHDLLLRGPGELFGDKQAGAPRMAIGDAALYRSLVVRARDAARAIVEADARLQQADHALLRASVLRRLPTVYDAYSG